MIVSLQIAGYVALLGLLTALIALYDRGWGLGVLPALVGLFGGAR